MLKPIVHGLWCLLIHGTHILARIYSSLLQLPILSMQFQIHEKVFLSEPATDSSLWLGGILCQALLQATEMNVSALPVGANAVRGYL